MAAPCKRAISGEVRFHHDRLGNIVQLFSSDKRLVEWNFHLVFPHALLIGGSLECMTPKSKSRIFQSKHSKTMLAHPWPVSIHMILCSMRYGPLRSAPAGSEDQHRISIAVEAVSTTNCFLVSI